MTGGSTRLATATKPEYGIGRLRLPRGATLNPCCRPEKRTAPGPKFANNSSNSVARTGTEHLAALTARPNQEPCEVLNLQPL